MSRPDQAEKSSVKLPNNEEESEYVGNGRGEVSVFRRLSALNLLKTLTWPSAIPTYSLQSNLLGSFTLDFSAWSGMLTALRSLIIALAGFVAYRIIFVGHA